MRRSRRSSFVDLDDRLGMGNRFWADLKAESERRMAIIDKAPRVWRDLVNEFDPMKVADLAGRELTAEEVRKKLTR